MIENYIEINKELWNKKTPIHVKSEFYDVESFKKGKTSLNPAELESLGDVNGKSLLHLQCHFGMDSLSWSRLGAKVTGVDLSDKAIEQACMLNDELGLDANFICSNVYDLKNNLEGKFDIVFTSYGTIGWLPDLEKWADIVSHFLKPGGTFFIAEFHPVRWMYDDDCVNIDYSYFNIKPIVEKVSHSYADKERFINHLSYGWNHPFSEVFSSLMKQNLQITEFKEYPYSYYKCFNNTIKNELGYWEIKGLEGKMPLMYSIKAVKPE
ncbi:MAG: methyltransferase domain-containing protein [Ignavibacteria bacterium]|nr:methyltransferase domain-containing protein [Ignavibacteria bacterium]